MEEGEGEAEVTLVRENVNRDELIMERKLSTCAGSRETRQSTVKSRTKLALTKPERSQLRCRCYVLPLEVDSG